VITLDAGQLARGWLAVNQATGKDDSATNPAMRKTVHVDQFPQGLRLVATDSYMLLTSWIPQADGYEPEPSLDEIPYASATVIDKHNRAVSLLSYLLALLRREGQADPGHLRRRAGRHRPRDAPAGGRLLTTPRTAPASRKRPAE
jgi:hypothetical protein